MKTYGENRIHIYNMKFTFICIVIVISCSVCACNNLDFYSGLNFNYKKPKNQDYVRSGYYSKFRSPFENVLPDDYDEPKLRELPEYDPVPDKIRQFQEVIDWERSQLHKHRPLHENPALLDYYFDKINKPQRFQLDIPTVPRLEEPKFYPSEDDLGYRNDDEKVDIQEIFADPIFNNGFENTEKVITNRIGLVNNEEERSLHSHHEVHPNDIDSTEFTTNRFNDVKVVENPSDFAYVPSDPRFYRKIIETTDKTNENLEDLIPKRDGTTKPKGFPSEKLLVSQRSDQILGSERIVQEANQKDGGIEVVPIQPNLTDVDSAGVYIIAIVAGISAAATVGLIAVGIGWYNLQKHVKNASDVEYPAYGVTGPNKDISPSGDRRLAQSAQMYHYQHQKQQIIAMERAPPGERHGSVSEAESDEENEEGDYTVYECPGLAPTGEMEVKNPLFQDDPTPAQTPATKAEGEEKK